MAKLKYGGNRHVVAKRLLPPEVVEAIKPIIAKAYTAFEKGKVAEMIRLLHYTDEFPYAGEFTKAKRAATCRVCREQVNKNSAVFILYYNFRGNTNTEPTSDETACYIHYKCVLPEYQEPDNIALA